MLTVVDDMEKLNLSQIIMKTHPSTIQILTWLVLEVEQEQQWKNFDLEKRKRKGMLSSKTAFSVECLANNTLRKYVQTYTNPARYSQ